MKSVKTPPILAVLLLAVAAAACRGGASKGTQAEELLIFAAASLTDVLGQAGDLYREQAAVNPVFNFAGSNILAHQIMAAPGADVFVSANPEWMDAVEEAGRTRGSTVHLWTNNLVVIAHPSSSWKVRDASDLCLLGFRYLSLGNPAAVPAGRYAREWLEKQFCKEGTLWDSLADRISPTPDVRAALAQVEANRGVVGIVYRTDYAAASDRVKIILAIPIQQGPLIRYSVARLKDGHNPQAADSFLQFLQSEPADKIFQQHGFLIPGDGSSIGLSE